MSGGSGLTRRISSRISWSQEHSSHLLNPLERKPQVPILIGIWKTNYHPFAVFACRAHIKNQLSKFLNRYLGVAYWMLQKRGTKYPLRKGHPSAPTLCISSDWGTSVGGHMHCKQDTSTLVSWTWGHTFRAEWGKLLTFPSLQEVSTTATSVWQVRQ